ncbi:MAG: VWA domain-containing protein [Thermoanaerobaculia bacterium]|nr:VWA domain-containing protein [Thermoanaerobaculia bacterium]
MSEVQFNDLWMLWILAPLFLLWLAAWWLLPRWRRDTSPGAVRFSSLDRAHRLRPSRTLLLRRLVQASRVVVVTLLILGMARPQTGRQQSRVRTEGVDIVLVLDTSGSMEALDLDADRSIERRRNRLEVARSVVEEFVRRRESDQIGLVVFGNEAFTQCPLTLDHGILATFLERLEIGMAGEGTAIGSAIGIAVKRLQDSRAESKIVILLTDGRNNAGILSPAKAAEVAASFGVKIYSIGVGTRGKAPFLVDSLFGRQVVYESVEMDEESLRQVAQVTGGRYFRAEDREALATIYKEIDRLEKTEITMDTYVEYDERFRAFVMPALGLLLLEVVLLGTRLRKLP